MPPDALVAILYILVGLAACVIALLMPKWTPILLVMVLPWGNFDLDWHVTFSLSKVVLIVFLLALPAQIAVNSRLLPRLRPPASLVLFLIVLVLSTLASYAGGEVAAGQGFDPLRGPQFRSVVQLLSLGLRVTALIVVLAWVTDTKSSVNVYKAILFLSTTIAAYGLYQFAGYYADWPIMGIFTAEPDLSGGYGLFQVAGLTIFRVGSFVGEPKEAAKFLLPSILLIVSAKGFPIAELRSWLTSYPVLALHVLAFVLTFATSSFFGIVVSAPLLALLWIGYRRGRLGSGRLSVATLVIVLAVTLLAASGGTDLSKQLFEARVTGRIGDVDNPERASIQFLTDHPAYLAAGIGLGNSSFYLRPYFDPHYYRPLTISQNSSYLQLVLEGGIPALVAFLIFLGAPLLQAIQIIRRNETAHHTALLATTAGICLTLAAVNAFSSAEGNGQIWVYWGLLIALCRMRQVTYADTLNRCQPVLVGQVSPS